MVKIDLKKTLPGFQAKRGQLDIVEIPSTNYVAIDGHGDPNTAPSYAAALESIYPVAYALKFLSAREPDRDYVVPPLEGLWWADNLDAFTVARDKSQWNWTMMLMVPEWVPKALFDRAVLQVTAKKSPPTRLDDVRWFTLDEATCMQTLHVGSYDDEGPILAHMHHEAIPAAGYRMTGTHHEIYLSDPRRTAAEKRRTILRQPMVAA